MSTGEQFEIGIVCGQCESFNALGTSQCASCEADLGLKPRAGAPDAETAARQRSATKPAAGPATAHAREAAAAQAEAPAGPPAKGPASPEAKTPAAATSKARDTSKGRPAAAPATAGGRAGADAETSAKPTPRQPGRSTPATGSATIEAAAQAARAAVQARLAAGPVATPKAGRAGLPTPHLIKAVGQLGKPGQGAAKVETERGETPLERVPGAAEPKRAKPITAKLPAAKRPAPAGAARPQPPQAERPQAPVSQEEPMEPARHYVCRSCASAVPRGHKFCGRCGTPVPVEVRDMHVNFFGDMQNPNKAKLILIRGEGMDGLSFHLKAEQHVVGREGQLIFPDDPFVSARHANFFYRDGKLWVRDEGSLNGVYIRIRGTMPLATGSTFLAGEQLFRLEKVEPVTDDGADAEGTAFYSSPRRESRFQLSQLFRGGAVGMRVQAHGSTMVVGRDGADLNFPDDLFMSGEHCRIDESDGRFTITDLNSRNGTYVRIEEERELDHGDYVFIGRKLLRVEINTN